MIANRASISAAASPTCVFITLSLGAALFGLVWLAFILGALLTGGVAALSPTLFTQPTPPPGTAGRAFQRHRRQRDDERAGRGFRARPSACSPAPIWPNMAATPSFRFRRALRQRYPAVARRPSSSACSSMKSWLCRWATSRPGPAPLSLMVIVIPVVVRTTENMLLLVPNGLTRSRQRAGRAA